MRVPSSGTGHSPTSRIFIARLLITCGPFDRAMLSVAFRSSTSDGVASYTTGHDMVVVALPLASAPSAAAAEDDGAAAAEEDEDGEALGATGAVSAEEAIAGDGF